MIEAAHPTAAGFFSAGRRCRGAAHMPAASVRCRTLSPNILRAMNKGARLQLTRAAERYKRRRRADQVDVPAAAAFGVVVAAAVYAYDLPVNQGYVFLGASLWDARAQRVPRLREIDRCTAELEDDCGGGAGRHDGRRGRVRATRNSAESDAVELQSRVADGRPQAVTHRYGPNTPRTQWRMLVARRPGKP